MKQNLKIESIIIEFEGNRIEITGIEFNAELPPESIETFLQTMKNLKNRNHAESSDNN